MFEDLILKLNQTNQAVFLQVLNAFRLAELLREKTPAERLDALEAAGGIGDVDTAGFTREDFDRLAIIKATALGNA